MVSSVAFADKKDRTRLRRRSRLARRNRPQSHVARLHRLVNAVLESGYGESSTLAHLANTLREIFRAAGVAIYDIQTRQIARAGPRATAISRRALEETACGRRCPPALADPTVSLAPILRRGEPAGSLAMVGPQLSESLLSAVADRIGLGLAGRSGELKSALLDAMAHEIRDPLNSVKLAAAALLSGPPASEAYRREMLAIVDEEVNRMDRIVDEAVQLARADAGQLPLRKRPYNIARLISAAIEEMSGLPGRRPLEVRVPDTLPPAECDRDMIARVLKQLLDNALKYSPADSPLTVSARCTGPAIVIDVVDRGPGVNDDERDRIFEKYYRGSAARAGARGTGLGLASARSIVQAHAGEIWVTSPPAGGAAFHVSLPVARAATAVG